MSTTCQRCGAVLVAESDLCECDKTCVPFTTEPVRQTTASSNKDLPTKTVPPLEYASSDEEGLRVDALLGQIAAQSHFEERYSGARKLASGGMGEVFQAFDRILQRDVAIKMMRHSASEGATAAARGQFLKEARVGGRLLHPNILAVFDLGVNRSGRIYYTMRLVEGASFQHCLDSLNKGALTKLINYPLRKTVEAFVGVCQGVDYAHQKGVIHLDLKPQNILVSGFHEVFVIDWGLARVDEVDDTEALVDLYRDRSSAGNTASNTNVMGLRAVGTPAYMAPEQARGNPNAYSAATDVYGLGGILYFILYGRPPNESQRSGEPLGAIGTPKQRGKLRDGILPRGWRVKKEAKDAVEALEAISLRALEIEQENRYPDVDSMIADLNDWLSTTPGPPHGF